VSCGVALVVFFCVMATRRGRRLPALLMLVMLLGCAIVFFVKTEPLKKRFVSDMPNQELTDLELRHELWDVAVRIWQDHPWLGAGPAHYDVLYRTYRPQDVQRQADRAHNEYLNVLADWGIVGGLIVVAGIGGLFLSVLKTWRHVRRSGSEFRSGLSNKFAFVLGASIGLLSLILHSAMDFNMEIPANAILAVTLTALLVSHLRFATERFWTSARPWMKVTLSTSLLATVVFLSWQEVGLGREYLLLDQASQKPAFSPARAAILEKAFAVQPNNFQTSYMIGEAYRMQSFEGGTNYVELAQRAMDWYERGIKINPYDGYNYLRYGMCLDWLEKYPEAEPYFDRAEQLDPNGYYMVAHIGRHYAERGDYAAARSWFLRSKLLKTGDNEIAEAWLNIVDQKLRQRATGQASLLER